MSIIVSIHEPNARIIIDRLEKADCFVLSLEWPSGSSMSIFADRAEQFMELVHQIESAVRKLAVQTVQESPDNDVLDQSLIEQTLERR